MGWQYGSKFSKIQLFFPRKLRFYHCQSSHCSSVVMNPASMHEDVGFDPWPTQAHRCSSNPTLLWLWCRLAAVPPIQLLAWELSYAMGAALKRQNKKKKDFTIVNKFIILNLFFLSERITLSPDQNNQCVSCSFK